MWSIIEKAVRNYRGESSVLSNDKQDDADGTSESVERKPKCYRPDRTRNV